MIKTWGLFFFIQGQINLIYLALCSQSVLKIAGNILPGCHRWICETLSSMDAKNHHYKYLSQHLPLVLSLCASESEVFLFLESYRESQKIKCVKCCSPSPSWAWSQSCTERKREASSSFSKALLFVQCEGGLHISNLWELSVLVIHKLISNSEYHSSMLTSYASL